MEDRNPFPELILKHPIVKRRSVGPASPASNDVPAPAFVPIAIDDIPGITSTKKDELP